MSSFYSFTATDDLSKEERDNALSILARWRGNVPKPKLISHGRDGYEYLVCGELITITSTMLAAEGYV